MCFNPWITSKVTQVNLTYPVSTLGSRRERKGHPETRHLPHVVGVLLIEHGKLSQGCKGRWEVGRGANALPKDQGPGRVAEGA
jgi:hypothetical protein